MERLTKQIIAFNRNRVITSLNTKEVPVGERNLVLKALTEELGEYGYILDNNAILQMSLEDMKAVHSEILPELHKLYHDGQSFKCLYPGFPEDVLSKSEGELESVQEDIYAGLIDIDEFIKSSPWYSEDVKTEIAKKASLLEPKVLKGMTEEEFLGIPHSIMVSGNSLQAKTKAELEWFLDNYADLTIPEKIPFKETQCIVMSRRNYVPKDVNDVLRYSIYIMGGNPELVNVPHKLKKYTNEGRRKIKKEIVDNPEWRNLKSLKRSERKKILSFLNSIVEKKGLYSSVCDAKRFYGHWVLLSERVHSGDYVSKFPKAAEFFKSLQTKEVSKEFVTWNSKIQSLYNTGVDVVEIAKEISSRPGELVRKFDSLFRRAKKEGKESDIMDVFLETDGMRNKTLIELLSYYDRRHVAMSRMIKPKNGVMKALPRLESMPKELIEVIQEVIVRKILINIDRKITEKDLLGQTVYVDPNLDYVPVPRDMKSRTDTVVAGYRVKLPESAGVVRFFVHWKQEGTRNEDLDLHVMFLNNECKTNLKVGFNSNLKIGDFVAHSGGVRNRVGDCAEYVDIDIEGALKRGCRYAVMNVQNYEGRGLNTLPCWLGYSVREKMVAKDEHWVPENVGYCTPITSTSNSIAAMLVDLEKMEVMFLDTAMNAIPGSFGGDIYERIASYFTTKQTFTTLDVVRQHYISRGATVIDTIPDTKEEFDAITKFVETKDIAVDYIKVLEMIGE